MATLKDLLVTGPARILGTIFGTSFVKSGGTSSQFLKADGSVDSTSYEPELPSKIGNDGKVLAVNSSATGFEWVKPVKIYSGTSVPSSSIGSDGDIYIQTAS